MLPVAGQRHRRSEQCRGATFDELGEIPLKVTAHAFSRHSCPHSREYVSICCIDS